jgi:UDP-GlcNAc:undecaprenyl-phosphate GlcNAc-1-phosphate transferase
MINAFALLLALAFSVASLLVLRPLAPRLGLIDQPGGRKTHSGAVPVVGGMAMYISMVIAAVVGAPWGLNGGVALAAAVLMVLVGVIDDCRPLRPRMRLVAHLLAATCLVYGTNQSVGSLGDLVGLGAFSLAWLAEPFTVIACIALINGFNMLDGLDGLAGSVALCALAGMAVLGGISGVPAVVVAASGMMGAVAGFLLFNLPTKYNRRFRVFMGDAGSTLLGFLLAALALALVQPGAGEVAPVLILWLLPIPIFELFTSTCRRLVRGLSPVEADSGHFHHRFLAAGFSVRVIFFVYLVVSAGSVAFALWAHSRNVEEPALFLGFIAFFCGWLGLASKARVFLKVIPEPLRRVGDIPLH